MTEPVASEPNIQSVETALTIIEGLQEMDGAGVTELAEELEVPKSTVHRHLSTLEQKEYLVREGDSFRLSYRFLDLGGYVRTREKAYEIVKPKVEYLAEQTGERVQFITREHDMGVFVYIESGENAVTTGVRTGIVTHLHTTSAGKAILAHLPPEEIDRIIEKRGLPSRTEQTITDREELLDDLEMVRERNYAFDMGEFVEGLWGVGVPVHGPEESVTGAISVAGPTYRMKDEWFEEEIPDMLLGVVNELELKLTYEL